MPVGFAIDLRCVVRVLIEEFVEAFGDDPGRARLVARVFFG